MSERHSDCTELLDLEAFLCYISTRLRGVLIPLSLSQPLSVHIAKITYGGFSKMAVNLTPLHDRVIVKRIEEKETRQGRHHHP